jgi:transposase
LARRGPERRTEGRFSSVRGERRVPAQHPLRVILPLVDGVPAGLAPASQRRYGRHGRPSLPPEQLLRVRLLQAFHAVRAERRPIEQLADNRLFRWGVGLGGDDPVGDGTVFTKNRDRRLEGEIAGKFPAAGRARPELAAPLSDGHWRCRRLRLAVDGTLLRARRRRCRRPRCGRLGWWPMGQPEVVPPRGRRWRLDDAIVQPGTGPHRRARRQGREARERDPCRDHRRGRAAVPPGRRRDQPALLPARAAGAALVL